VSAYPLMLDGATLSAVVVGGGRVATRKVIGLLAAGANVHVVAPQITPELEQLAVDNQPLRLTHARFSDEHLGEALLVIVATDDAVENTRIAATAKARGRLVNVVTAPEQGNCSTPAVHRAGGVTVAVGAGRVPTAAARIRDRLASIVDVRYADAVRELSALRARLLEQGGEARDRWIEANEALVGEDFCARVEAGDFDAGVAAWR
jgi:siroheme synthase-like protein